jgi:hypothetical protein
MALFLGRKLCWQQVLAMSNLGLPFQGLLHSYQDTWLVFKVFQKWYCTVFNSIGKAQKRFDHFTFHKTTLPFPAFVSTIYKNDGIALFCSGV